MRKMHERNIYKVPPDFAKLAEEYKEFGKHITVSEDGRGHLNFKAPGAVRELTYTLLKHDFGLTLEIPLDRLIPTVPLRLNYILWIEDLLKESSLEADAIKGIDIGCGASCIYPLLGAKLNNWSFLASESDDLSLTFAKKNIEVNNLSSKITLKKGNFDTLLKGTIESGAQYDFCMCNPPFFSDREEASGLKSRTDKRPIPHSVCTAADDETITEGGEVAFVKKIIQESIELKQTVRWYTSMLGKKTSLKALKLYLREQKVPSVTHTVFQQGKTARWGICWSFHNKVTQKPKLSPAVKINPLPFAFVVPKSEIMKRYSEEQYRAINDLAKVKLVSSDIKSLLTGLEVQFTESTSFNDSGDVDYMFIGEAWKNTWSHQRLKRRLEKRLKIVEQVSEDSKSTTITAVPALRKQENDEVNATAVKICSDAGPSFVDKSREHTPCKEDYDTMNDGQTEQAIGAKRPHFPVYNESKNCSEKPLFGFKIRACSNRDSESMETEPIRVEIFCLEGNRESLHQVFMYLRNNLNGIQRHQKK